MEKLIVKATYVLRTKEEMVVQPFSSKISRTAVLSFSNTYKSAISSTEPLKPFRVTALHVGKKPLYSRGFVTLYKDKEYRFSVTSLLDDFLQEVISNSTVDFTVYNKQLRMELEKVEVSKVDQLTLPDSRLYRIEFLTPTLLQVPRPKFRRLRNRYVLFPYSPLLMASLTSHWNKFMHPAIVRTTGSRALYYFREVDYQLEPITVNYDNGSVRGFVGWALFSLIARKGTKLRDMVRTLLGYANFVGVGKSRSIGFGEVEAKPG